MKKIKLRNLSPVIVSIFILSISIIGIVGAVATTQNGSIGGLFNIKDSIGWDYNLQKQTTRGSRLDAKNIFPADFGPNNITTAGKGTFNTLVSGTGTFIGDLNGTNNLLIMGNGDISGTGSVGSLVVGGNKVINSNGKWVGSIAGLQGIQGNKGIKGAKGATGATGLGATSFLCKTGEYLTGIDLVNGTSTCNKLKPVFNSTTKTFITLPGRPLTLATVTATDPVDGIVTVTQGGVIPDFNTLGTYLVTYSATDAAGNTSTITHTYKVRTLFYLAANGVTVKCPFANVGDTRVVNGITYTKRTKAQITTTNASTTCTSGITDMSIMFDGARKFNQDISSWDISSVTNMSGMFGNAYLFNQPLNSWDVSSVTNMNNMFSRAKLFNQPLNSWDVSSVTNMSMIFNSTRKFNQDISSWDVSSVTNMSWMFSNATAFNQPLNSWDVSSVTNMSGMFYWTIFNQPLNSWDVSSVTNMSSMFNRAQLFNQPLNSWDVSSVTNMSYMFYSTTFNQPLNSWIVNPNVVNCGIFAYNTTYTLPKPNFTSCTP